MFLTTNNMKFWISCNTDDTNLTVTWLDDEMQKEYVLLLNGERFSIYDVIQRIEKWSAMQPSELRKLAMRVL